MNVKRWAYFIFFALATIAVLVVVLNRRGKNSNVSLDESSDVLEINKYYGALTNRTIHFVQKGSGGALEGNIIIRDKNNVEIDWIADLNYIGKSTNSVYKSGNSAIWKVDGRQEQYPSLSSAVEATKGTSHLVSYLVPGLILKVYSLGESSRWKPVIVEENGIEWRALEQKKPAIHTFIFYDPNTHKIIKTRQKMSVLGQKSEEETTYEEREGLN